MKTYRNIALSILVVTCAAFTTAASAQGLTRADVRADLVRVEQAGYHPNLANDQHYPYDIEKAEAQLARQSDAQLADNAIGSNPSNGTSVAGHRIHSFGNVPSSCIGPASFCNIYAGG